MYQVYVVVNKLNGKMYVGSTERDLKIRWQKHVSRANDNSLCSLHKAIRKYGKENFDIRMIEEYSSRAEMLAGEMGWISYFDTYKSSYGYNDTIGGEGGNTNGGKKFSEEWKVNISKSLSGKPQTSKRRFSTEIEQEICRLYVEEKKSTYVLGNKFDCQRNMISSILKRNHIQIRRSNYTGHSNNCNIFSLEKELEICLLFQSGLVSRTELSNRFNCGKTTIRDILLRHNIIL